MISKKVSSFFEPIILSRGEGLFAERAAQLQSVSGDAAKLSVVGGEKYKNVFFWNNEKKVGSNAEMVAYCDCPYHQEYNLLCKHNWAALKSLEGTAFFFSPNVSKSIKLLTAGSVAEAQDVSVEDLLSGIEEKMSNGQRSAGVGKAAVTNSDWKNHLDLFKEEIKNKKEDLKKLKESDSAKSGALSGKVAEPWQEIVYVIEVPYLRNKVENVEVRLLQRSRSRSTKNWSKLKKFEVPYYGFYDKYIDREDDREVLRKFSQNINSSNYYSHYKDRLIFSPALALTALKEIAKTGRLSVLLEDTSYAKQEPLKTQVCNEEGEFALKIIEDEFNWNLMGVLEVGKDSFDLSEQRILTGVNIALCRSEEKTELVSFSVPSRLQLFYDSFLKLGKLSIPKDNKEDFLLFIKEYLPYDQIALPKELGIKTVATKGVASLEVVFEPSHVSAELFFYYGLEKHTPNSEGLALGSQSESNVFLAKDFSYEKKMAKTISKVKGISILNNSSVAESSEVFYKIDNESFVKTVQKLEDDGIIVKARGKKLSSAKSFSSRISSHINWFELTGEVEFGDIRMSMPQILKRAKDEQGLIRLDNGEMGVLPQEWLKKIQRLKEFAIIDGETVRFDRSQALILDGLLSEQDFDGDKKFRQLLEKLNKSGKLDDVDPSKKFNGQLREYQKDGLAWMTYLEEIALGGCLADDMGLGKTVQVLSLLQKRKQVRKRENKTSLIVIPKSLMYNWINETKKFTPNLTVLAYEGADRHKLIKEFEDYDIILMTYAVLRIDMVKGCFENQRFDYTILDEAQNIKNDSSLTAKASYLIKADHRLALTGTPVENHAGDLFSIFRFLNPGLFNKKIKSYKSLSDIEDDESTRLLLKGLRPFILRREKKAVLKDLPDKEESILYCDLTTKQQQEYNKIKNYYKTQLMDKISSDGMGKSKIQVLEGLTRLRQAACHPGLIDADKLSIKSGKIESLVDQLKTIKEEGKKALVFSQFTSMLKIIGERLQKEELSYCYLDGQTKKREEVIEEFKTAKDIPLFLISLKAGGVGLNLVEASYCFIVDPWWNPAVENQAIDRAYRIGQKNKVMAYKLISRGTVEEKILELQNQKKKLYDDILHSDENLLRRMSIDDVQFLFS